MTNEKLNTIVIDPAWLRACGKAELEGYYFPVIAQRMVRGFDFYTVRLPDGREWDVMEWRLAK